MKRKLKVLLVELGIVFLIDRFARKLGMELAGGASGSGSGSLTGGAVDSPTDLPKHKWKQAMMRTKQALKDKDLGASAAALSYYTTLTFFPALLGLASCYAIFAEPQGLMNAIESLEDIVPAAIYELIEKQLTPLAEGSRQGLGVAALVSIGALLWTTSGGMQNLVRAMNKAYEAKETRKFIKLRLVSLALSVVLLVVGGVILCLLLAQGSALESLGAPAFLADVFPVIRWPILIVLISIILSVVYRYAPDRQEPHWQWVSWGAAAATIIWLAATALFFIYVQNFGKYTETYGAFAGIVILMIWFNITSLIILLGAQVNKKLEEVAPKPAKISAE